MIVQIYEVGNSTEAQQLVGVGVDYIGVLVGKGEYPRELSIEQATTIFQSVSERAKKVALSLSRNLEDISEIVEKTNPDILHLGTMPDYLLQDDVIELKQRFPNLKIMRTVPVVDEESIELAKEYDGIADYLLLDSRKTGDTQVGATGETHNWNISRKIVESVKIPVILAGGLGPDNVVEAIEKVKPAGVDSKTKTDKAGSNEKDIEKVEEFVRLAKGNRGNS